MLHMKWAVSLAMLICHCRQYEKNWPKPQHSCKTSCWGGNQRWNRVGSPGSRFVRVTWVRAGCKIIRVWPGLYHVRPEMESDEDRDDDGGVSPQVTQKRIIDGDYILKKKNAKGSRAWEQFRIVLDYSNNSDFSEVFGVACCCSVCVRYAYFTKGRWEEKKDLKRCLPARTSARDKLNDSTSSTETSTSS